MNDPRALMKSRMRPLGDNLKAQFRLKRANLSTHMAYFKPEEAEITSERAGSWPERTEFRHEGADFDPEACEGLF